MRNARSFPRTLSCIIWLASLSVCGPALADDADLTIAGPTGRSSIAFSTSRYLYSHDTVSLTDGLKLGDQRSDSRYATLSGIYAVNDRVSLSLDLLWNYRTHQEFNSQGINQVTDSDGLGKVLGASAVLVDQRAVHGYRLVGSFWASLRSGASTAYLIGIQPQYWFSEDALLVASYTAHHQANVPGIKGLALNLLWRMSPQVWITPNLSLNRVDASAGYKPYLYRTLGLDATYRLDDSWSASVGYRSIDQSDLTSDVYGGMALTLAAEVGRRG